MQIVRNNRSVILANRTPDKATELAATLGPLSMTTNIASANKNADIIV